jgi:type 1 glutamine amidotransferase
MTIGFQTKKTIKIAVVTGGHPFDVVNFHQLFRSLEGVDAYIQHIDEFSTSSQQARDSYDVVVFYLMMMNTPQDTGVPPYAGQPKTALENLGNTEQGIVVLHHAILAYLEWPVWSEIVGISDRKFGYYNDQILDVQIANHSHPITQGMQGWRQIDETYTMQDASAGSTILLSADHPKSMKTIAWVREYKKSRVFCYESGHDQTTYGDANFRKTLAQGIAWTARLI